jgi:hypothetical protein
MKKPRPFFESSMPWWQRIGALILVCGVIFGMFWPLFPLLLDLIHYVRRWLL